MKLLLAVDTVTTLNILLDYMESRYWPKGTEAHVLSVVEDDSVPIETWRSKGYGIAAVRHEMRRRGEQVNSLVNQRLRELGIPTQVTVMRGDPAFLISFAARKWSSDLILIRAHNRVEFRNWLLGSVAKSVVAEAPCSVEVVREPAKRRSDAATRDMRILIATDGSDASTVASQALSEMEYPEGTEIKVVSIVNPITYSMEEVGLTRGRESERAHHAIGKTVSMLKSMPHKVTAEVMAGRRVRQIVERAKDWEADLIVVGAEPRRGLKRLLSRGTAANVADRAHCSVTVVRRQLSENEESSQRYKFGSFRNAA